jgi:hypothetical protein
MRSALLASKFISGIKAESSPIVAGSTLVDRPQNPGVDQTVGVGARHLPE